MEPRRSAYLLTAGIFQPGQAGGQVVGGSLLKCLLTE